MDNKETPKPAEEKKEEDLVIGSSKIVKLNDDSNEDIDELDLEEWEYNLNSNIANLAGAYSNLQEIDPGLMNKEEQKRLKRMKKQIFKSLLYYCESLPDIYEAGKTPDPEEENDD